MLRALTLAGIVLGSVSMQASATEVQAPAILAPAGSWQVDFAEQRCRAIRMFGPEDRRTVLILEQLAPGGDLRWLIAGGAVQAIGSKATKFDVQFGPGFDRWGVEAHFSTTFGEFGRSFRGNSFRPPVPTDQDEPAKPGLAGLDPEEGKAISWIELNRKDRTPQRLATGPMGDLFKVLNSCTESLVGSWGLNVEREKTLLSRPEPLNLDQVVKRILTTYPLTAEMSGAQAELFFRVIVGGDGLGKSCEMVELTSARLFNDAACKAFMKLARFKPAIAADGQPTESYYTGTVVYRL